MQINEARERRSGGHKLFQDLRPGSRAKRRLIRRRLNSYGETGEKAQFRSIQDKHIEKMSRELFS
jgi:hypothetical protein